MYTGFMFTFQVAVRLIQLAYLELIAPIPIIMYITPKGDEQLKKWGTQCTTTFLDFFLRVAIIYFAKFIVEIILNSNALNIYADSNGFESLYLTCIMIIATLIFVKKVPNLLKEIFPSLGGAAAFDYGLSFKKQVVEPLKWAYNTPLGWGLKLGKKAKIHIKVDTGMSRIGFIPCEESLDTVEKISKLPGLEVEGIFTHFARADEKTIEPAREPFRKYITFVEELEKRGVMIPIHHVSNSASIIGFSEANLDMVRSGITTYGLYPSNEVAKDVLILEPAMQWKSIISYIKTVEPGTSISYGGTFTAKEKMTVATIPVGYADGMKRDLSGKGRVLIHGQYAPILGRICMDQFMVDVSHIKEAAIGDTVTIFGKDGEKNIPVEEIAEKSHSFNYEFVCSITNRVPRKYLGE